EVSERVQRGLLIRLVSGTPACSPWRPNHRHLRLLVPSWKQTTAASGAERTFLKSFRPQAMLRAWFCAPYLVMQHARDTAARKPSSARRRDPPRESAPSKREFQQELAFDRAGRPAFRVGHRSVEGRAERESRRQGRHGPDVKGMRNGLVTGAQ